MGLSHAWVIDSVGEKTQNWASSQNWSSQNLSGPIFSKFWLGQNLTGPIMAWPLFFCLSWAIICPAKTGLAIIGSANFF